MDWHPHSAINLKPRKPQRTFLAIAMRDRKMRGLIFVHFEKHVSGTRRKRYTSCFMLGSDVRALVENFYDKVVDDGPFFALVGGIGCGCNRSRVMGPCSGEQACRGGSRRGRPRGAWLC